jgi:hypothetical protein
MPHAKIILVRLAVALAAAMTLIGLALPAAGPASASSLPKIQTAGMGGNWSGTWRVRPGLVAFGAHFLVQNLRYRYYTAGHAYAHGRLLVDRCRPNCVSGGHYVNATAYFWDVFNHRGPGNNFGSLRLRWGKHRSMLLWINGAGAWQWSSLSPR